MRSYVNLKIVKFVLLVAATGALCFSCDFGNGDGRVCLDGEGALVPEMRPVNDDFIVISHQIPGSVFITQGSPAELTLQGQANLLPFVTSEISNEILTLAFDGCLNSGMPIDAFITVPNLRAVSLAGIGNIIFVNDIISTRLETSILGSGDLDLRGNADTLEVIIIGQGNVNGFGMISDRCLVNIAGQGNVEVTANNELDVLINGQGNVFYKGMPIINSEINGQGEVIDFN